MLAETVGQDDAVAVVEAWLVDGPADGRFLVVELTAAGLIPETVRLPQTGVYVGVSDVPAPLSEHLYARANDMGDQVVYQYVGSVKLER